MPENPGSNLADGEAGRLQGGQERQKKAASSNNYYVTLFLSSIATKYQSASLRNQQNTAKCQDAFNKSQLCCTIAIAMEASFTHLPDEILHSILCYSPPSAAVALERTARRFRSIANEPLLWRYYCVTHFSFWEHRHDFKNKLADPVSSIDWKRLYASRHLTDSTVSSALESILSSQRGRLEKFRVIISFGYDAKDTLIRNALTGPEREDHLARRLALRSIFLYR